MTPKKRGGNSVGFLLDIYLFRSISINTSPTATIAIIMPIVAGSKYSSAVCPYGGAAVGGGEACGASSTFKYVMAAEGP